MQTWSHRCASEASWWALFLEHKIQDFCEFGVLGLGLGNLYDHPHANPPICPTCQPPFLSFWLLIQTHSLFMPKETNAQTHWCFFLSFFCWPASNAALYISNDMAVTIARIERYHTVNPAWAQENMESCAPWSYYTRCAVFFTPQTYKSVKRQEPVELIEW